MTIPFTIATWITLSRQVNNLEANLDIYPLILCNKDYSKCKTFNHFILVFQEVEGSSSLLTWEI